MDAQEAWNRLMRWLDIAAGCCFRVTVDARARRFEVLPVPPEISRERMSAFLDYHQQRSATDAHQNAANWRHLPPSPAQWPGHHHHDRSAQESGPRASIVHRLRRTTIGRDPERLS